MTSNTKRPVRVYADTSVFGGVFDEEFAEPSKRFFEQVDAGRYSLVTSPVLRDELIDAPPRVRHLYERYVLASDGVAILEDAILLQQAYLNSGIVGRKWETDALHVAIATVSACRLIVSWNFKHIVNFQKIPLYNGVNLSLGFGVIAIHSPQEVVENDSQDEDL